MIDEPFRKFLPKLTNGLVNFYDKKGLHPNQITIAGFLLAALSAIMVALGLNAIALITWWLGRLLDGTDGIFARKFGKTSAYGAVLDIVCDMGAYSLVILGFLWANPEYPFLWGAILVGYVLCITSALSLGSQIDQLKPELDQTGRGIKLAAGLAEAGETGIAYTLMLVVPSYTFEIASLWLAVLVVTIIARMRVAKNLFPVG